MHILTDYSYKMQNMFTLGLVQINSIQFRPFYMHHYQIVMNIIHIHRFWKGHINVFTFDCFV